MSKITRDNGIENIVGTPVVSNIMGKEKDRFVFHSRSTSATSSDMKTFDSESLMNLELSSQATSSTSSGANAPSCTYNNRIDLDMRDAMACPLNIRKRISLLVIHTSDTGELREVEEFNGIDVIAYGTKLMATILFPTVIIKTNRKKLHDSMLYYVVVEPSAGEYSEEIVCLMFSSPYNSGKKIQTAELLPLCARSSESCPGGVSLVPMLLDKRFRSMFEEGCTFRVKAIEQGRRLNHNARKWKDYDVEKSEIPQLLRRLLYLDIKQIPIHMFSPLASSSNAENLSRKLVPVKQKSHLKPKLAVDLQIRNLPKIYEDTRPRRRTGRRRSSFAKFLKTSPHTRASKDLVSYLKPRQRSEDFEGSYKLNSYVSLSGTI